MKWWFGAAVCGLLLVACSAGTTDSSESAAGSAEAPASRATTGRTPGSQPDTDHDAQPPGGPPPRHVSALRCFGRRPTFVGTPSGDRIRGTSGNDVIVSLGGNDVIRDLNKDDAVCTGSGDDHVIGPGHTNLSPVIDLGEGDDRMTHVEYAGLVRAGPGDDSIVFTRKGSGEVAPGPGDDLVRAIGVRPRFGATPCVRLVSATGPVRVNLARGRATGQGHDRLVNIRCVVAGRFSDVLIGTDLGDEIWTGRGLNLVRVGAGDDVVHGGARADEVHLGSGDDTADAWAGWDQLYGGPGTDQITGGPHGDYLDGGSGNDYLYSGEGCFEVWQPPVDLDAMMTSSAPNEVFGGDGNDFLAGERGNDRLDGGAGFDAGTGGYHDGRIEWVTSLARPDECDAP